MGDDARGRRRWTEAVDIFGKTALMWAAMDGHTDTVTALVGTHGADVVAVDEYGWTALKHAAENGHRATVTALRAFLHPAHSR